MGASGRLGGALAGRHLGGAGHADRWRHPAEIPDRYLASDTEPGSVPVRLTRSAEGEGSPAFLPDGSLAFVPRRPDGTSLGEQKRADAYPIWERVQQEVAAEFGGAEVQELLIRLRRLTGGSERLAGIRAEVDH